MTGCCPLRCCPPKLESVVAMRIALVTLPAAHINLSVSRKYLALTEENAACKICSQVYVRESEQLTMFELARF